MVLLAVTDDKKQVSDLGTLLSAGPWAGEPHMASVGRVY
jgi:hypothetical protein